MTDERKESLRKGREFLGSVLSNIIEDDMLSDALGDDGAAKDEAQRIAGILNEGKLPRPVK